jgi:hypothetical protein
VADHPPPFFGVSASANPVSFDAIEHRVVVDQLALMRQIGAL